jgi:hypothetical protein
LTKPHPSVIAVLTTLFYFQHGAIHISDTCSSLYKFDQFSCQGTHELLTNLFRFLFQRFETTRTKQILSIWIKPDGAIWNMHKVPCTFGAPLSAWIQKKKFLLILTGFQLASLLHMVD